MKKIAIGILGVITLLIAGCGELGYSDIESELIKIQENSDKVKYLNEKISSEKILDEDIEKVLTLKEKIEQTIKIQNEINGYKTKIGTGVSYLRIAELQKEINENKIIPDNEKKNLNLRLKNSLSDKFVGSSVTPEKLEKNYKELINAGLLNDRIKELYSKVKDSLEKELRVQHSWQETYFVDEFGEKTGEIGIKKSTKGTFSNSATRDSNLYVELISGKDWMRFELIEYLPDRAPATFNKYNKPVIHMRNDKGENIKIISSAYGSEPYLYNSNFNKIEAFFKRSNKVKFVIQDKYSSSYKFELDTRFYKK